MAKQFFLHGDENGKRLLDPKKLADKVDCAVGTIYEHIGSWIEEHERMLMERNGSQWTVALSEQSLEKYKRDVAWVEKETAAVQAEIDAHEESVVVLREMLRRFDFEKGDAKVVVAAIQTYLQTVGSKKYLREHWMKVEKFWIEISGMASRISIAETFEKEIAKETARRKGKGGDESSPANEDIGGGGFFDF